VGRAEFQQTAAPQLVADVRMYATEMGGREQPAPPGWGCLCTTSPFPPFSGYDALLLLRDSPLRAGETRRIGFTFLSPEQAPAALRAAGHFYLWDGRVVGEAEVVDEEHE
jgi:hypothetical protein